MTQIRELNLEEAGQVAGGTCCTIVAVSAIAALVIGAKVVLGFLGALSRKRC